MALAIETRGLLITSASVSLQNVDLRVPTGALCAILGAPGSGKSTLIKLLLGFEDAEVGQRLIFGRENIHQLDVRLGYMPQANNFYEMMTVRETLRLSTLVSRQTFVDEETMQALLETVKLSIQPSVTVAALDLTQRQRLSLAKALIGRPEILLLDEPAASLPGDERQEILRVISEISSRKTVVFTTSVFTDARDSSNWLVLLHEGKVHAQGATSDLLQNADYADYSLTIAGDCSTVHELLTEQDWVHSIETWQEHDLSRWKVRVHDEAKADLGLLRAILADRSLRIIEFYKTRPRLRPILDDMSLLTSPVSD
jgi:ABC-2 type transport system ATP-binding protein